MSDNEQKIVFSHNLSMLLRDRNKTQVEVASAIGVSPQTFNTWVQGVAIPRMGKIQLLADYFNVSKSALIDPAVNPASNITFSPEESAIALAYRKADEGRKEAVAILLGVKREGTADSTVSKGSVG